MIFNLSKGQTCLISPEDYDALSKHTWWVTNFGYVTTEIRHKGVTLHVFLMGTRAGLEIDHINRNRLDNRRENLRWATRSQNMVNKTPRGDKFKGVYVRESKWRAGIRANGKQVWLGTYNSPEEAARVYNEAALKFYGEFAWLNPV